MAWGWQRYINRTPDLTFTPISGLPGWRQTATGALSGGSASDAVFLGIGEDAVTPLPAKDLCRTLYSTSAPGLPIAVFTDINCPNCRNLEAKLAARQGELSVTWLQLPLLGPTSVAAARVSAAATALSDASFGPPQTLRGTGLAPLIRHYADQATVDPNALSDAIDAPKTQAILDRHASAAETLGIWGTPAMTIGKTLIMGDVASEVLDQLLAMDHPICT